MSFEILPSEALHQTVLMTVDGTQPKSTDKSKPAILTYLGTTPPQWFVLELRFHKSSTWAVLLFYIKLKH